MIKRVVFTAILSVLSISPSLLAQNTAQVQAPVPRTLVTDDLRDLENIKRMQQEQNDLLAEQQKIRQEKENPPVTESQAFAPTNDGQPQTIVVAAPVEEKKPKAMADYIGPVKWTDGPDRAVNLLSQQFTDIQKSADGGSVVGQGLFAGEKALTAYYFAAALYLNRVEFSLDHEGQGEDAYRGFKQAYDVLKQMYGDPDEVDLVTGERLWVFEDGSKISLLHLVEEKEEAQKFLGIINGDNKGLKGTLEGKSRHTGTDGETDSQYTLELKPSDESNNTNLDGHIEIKKQKVTTMVRFSRPLSAQQQATADAAASAPASVG